MVGYKNTIVWSGLEDLSDFTAIIDTKNGGYLQEIYDPTRIIWMFHDKLANYVVGLEVGKWYNIVFEAGWSGTPPLAIRETLLLYRRKLN